MQNAQNFENVCADSVRHNKGRSRDDQFARAGNAPLPSDFRIFREQGFDCLADMTGDPDRRGRTIRGYESTKRREVIDRFRRPADPHARVGFGGSSSWSVSQDSIQPRTAE